MADKLTLDKHAMNDKSTAHLRIYVGGLTDDATVDELYNHFIEYGNIDGIIINRIFGFVQFQQESSAQEAINKANGSILQGRKITVRTAQRHGPNLERLKKPNIGHAVFSMNGQAQPGSTILQQNINVKREPEVVTIQQDKPPAVALTEAANTGVDETTEDAYDAFGNYVGDRSYSNEEFEEGYNKPGWNEPRGGPRGRARGVRGRGRGGNVNFRERSPSRSGEWSERKYDRYPPPEYPRALPTPERNDCEIIVVAKSLTEYAEYIEGRLKRLGIVVDLLFPMEDVPIGKVLGNIASRGCLYAILVMPLNQENRSLTLTILHGLPQEHRDMPLEDALQLLSRNFQEVQRGGPSGREAVYALLGQLADGRRLTVLQYEKVIEYLQERKEQQVKIELGELPSSTTKNKTEVVLQQRILSILNDKKSLSKPESPLVAPPPPSVKQEPQNKLLNDPTVRKALDSILQKFV